ncbi:CcoQ/FixQ family Cbb3-type cytochrome c oxidase assembly chaperone [Rheinheimera sp.]|uniref:cbb3-type cytochrome oxidase subunit 3 n=1 Tax=Rheinheimera sp. TaxID=1869214 RepID=UPI00307D26A5
MDFATLHSIFTVVVFVGFISLVVWLFLLKRRPDFDEQANLPFADDKPQQQQKQESDHE